MNHSPIPAADEISSLDAQAQADLVRRGQVPPTAPVEAAIARIEALNDAVNAVSHRAFDHAREAASKVDKTAPRAGVPYLLKASMEYPGFPITAGARVRKGSFGTRKYPFAQQLDAAGLIPCGMSTMPEFGLMGTGEALLYGPTRNPWNTAHASGGSSSGAAVAVALCMTPLATASDGGGSIRIPASHCGVVGFKPSRNWNYRARAAGLIDDFLTSDALIARSMRDTIWAARFLRSQPAARIASDRRLRIALCLRGLDGQPPDANIAEVITNAGRVCEALGHHVEPADPPLDVLEPGRAFETLWWYGAGEVVDLSRAKLGEEADALLEPWTLGLAHKRDTAEANTLAQALLVIGRIDAQLEKFWASYDVVLSPVASSTAPPLGLLAPDRDFDTLYRDHFRHVNYTQLQNMAGLPALSLPLFVCADGLPAGAMFWGQYGADDVLLALGAALEHAHPWAARLPPPLALAKGTPQPGAER